MPPDTSDVALAFGVPDAPAFTFLGISPAKVTRASTARDLGVALINAIDSTGHVVTGVALGATLWTLLPDITVPLDSYRSHLGAYALANAQLSLGAARASGDSSDTDLGLGLRTTLYDGSDPMRNAQFVHSLTAALANCAGLISAPNLPPPSDTTAAAPPPSATDPALECVADANNALRRNWFRDNWNRPSASIGAALGWRIPGSELGALNALGSSLWITGSLPYGRSAQLLAQVQLDHRNRRDTLSATNVLTYGVRVVRGTNAQNLFFELASTQRLDASAVSSRSNVQWSGGVELEVAENYWLSTGFGKRYTSRDQPDRVVLIANLRWGISSRARLRMLPTYAPGQ